MDPAKRLRLQFNLGWVLIGAGGLAELLGGRWIGVALLALGAAVYFPASHRIKAGISDPPGPRRIRRFWSAAVAVLIAVVLAPQLVPRLDPQTTAQKVWPIALIAGGVLLAYFYWIFARRRHD